MKALRLILLTSSLGLASCDVITDQIFDCIDGDKPELDINSFPTAVLNEVYFVEFTAHIDNEPNDSNYYYYFDYESELPYGISLNQSGGSRKVSLSGVPTEVGSFSFTLNVYVDDPYQNDSEDYDDGDNLCSDRESRSFTLKVVTY